MQEVTGVYQCCNRARRTVEGNKEQEENGLCFLCRQELLKEVSPGSSLSQYIYEEIQREKDK